MDFLGNRILTVEVDPSNPLDDVFLNHFFQSGKFVFFETSYCDLLAKLHVFDMNSVNEDYEKNGELICSSSGHESQTSFKSRSICIKHRNFRYTNSDYLGTILADKDSVSLYAYGRKDLVARKSKLSFWNGKENPIFGPIYHCGDEDDEDEDYYFYGEIDLDDEESD